MTRTTLRRRKGYGLIADLPDVRDLLLGEAQPRSTFADLRPAMPDVYTQGQTNSCVGNGVAAVMEHAWIVGGKTDFLPSRLFIYYNARAIEGGQSADQGAQIRDGLKAVATWGACHEACWPFDAMKIATEPDVASFTDGALHRAIVYYRVQRDLAQIKGCLNDGYPVVFGMAVYESFESAQVAKSGVVPMPSLGEPMVGGHCMVIVGFDDTRSAFLVRNSWGHEWGTEGHCWLPYPFVLNRNLTSDFWTIRKAE